MTLFDCRSSSRAAIAVAAALVAATACEREERRFQEGPPTPPAYAAVSLDTLQPGVPSPDVDVANSSERNAYDLSEGKRLFESWNCSGCHSHGGGGMGPALMDDRWIYGSRPGNIFASIVEGRPNGMPTWRNKIPDQQVWQIVAYIQSLNGQAPIDVLPGRSDHLSGGTPENLRPVQPPVETGTP